MDFRKLVALYLVGIALLAVATAQQSFNQKNRQQLERITFGEARGEGQAGQQAVAQTIMNRYNDRSNFPAGTRQGDDRVNAILNKRYKGRNGQSYHEYNTLDNRRHSQAFEEARRTNSREYQSVQAAVDSVLSGRGVDSTGGATFFDGRRDSFDHWGSRLNYNGPVGNHHFFSVGRSKQ